MAVLVSHSETKVEYDFIYGSLSNRDQNVAKSTYPFTLVTLTLKKHLTP